MSEIKTIEDYIVGWDALAKAAHMSRVQLWRLIRMGQFPAPLRLGLQKLAWKKSDISEWLLSRPRRVYTPWPDNTKTKNRASRS